MIDLWSRFAAEFQQQTLFSKLSFLVPFIGLPTLIGILSNWSTKARLRKLADGRAAEIKLLREEVSDLKAASFGASLTDAESSDEAYAASDLEDVFTRNKDHLIVTCENIANEKIISWWQTGQRALRDEALYYAKVAVAVSSRSLIGRTILAITLDPVQGKKTDKVISSIPALGQTADPELVDRTIGLLSEKCSHLAADGKNEDVILYARYGFLYVSSEGHLHSASGYNTLYWLVRGLIQRYHGKSISEEEKFELRSAAEEFVDIVDATFRDRDHLTQFVAKFHYATVLHMTGEDTKALNVLEQDDLPARVGDCVGPESSACFATRHLYANLLYEAHRPKDAEETVGDLKRDLLSAGKLSKGHILTYKKWAELARSRQYEAGKRVNFQNLAHLIY